MQADPLLGQVIDGRFRILERIGEGGMGVVYKAQQVSIDRPIAVKMLAPHLAADPNWVQRFNNEARACSKLQHPNTIRIFDFGQTRNGELYMAMELLEGRLLRHFIDQEKPHSALRVANILRQCCASLSEAHDLGIIHRDIKPGNVLIRSVPGSPEFVKILDFSVAKLRLASGIKTQAGVVFGTPQYMSPEHGLAAPVDGRTDLYAVAIIGYEMLSGAPPFRAATAMDILKMHRDVPPTPLPEHLPAVIRHIIMTGLAKDPNRRFQTAQDMMAACEQAQTQLRNAGEIDRPFGLTASASDKTIVPGMGGHAPAIPQHEIRTVVAPNHGGSSGVDTGKPTTQLASELDTLDLIESVTEGVPAARPHEDTLRPGPGPLHTSNDDAGESRTVLLGSTEGVVSLAARQKAQPSSPGYPGQGPGRRALPDGVFWVICLLGGIVGGVLLYLLVRAVD